MAFLLLAPFALLLLAGIPLALGKVPPNGWYGFRTGATLSDEHAWYFLNRICGFDMIACGVAGAAIFAGIPYLNLADPQAAILYITTLMALPLAALVHCMMASKRLTGRLF